MLLLLLRCSGHLPETEASPAAAAAAAGASPARSDDGQPDQEGRETQALHGVPAAAHGAPARTQTQAAVQVLHGGQVC